MENQRSKQLKFTLLSGLLPVVLFTVIEEYYGVIWGLVAGMVFGLGEILWEWRTQRKVSPIVWGGNAILLSLGGISLVTQNGIWFKLQPALIELAMVFLLWGSLVMKKPLLLIFVQKQESMLPHLFNSGSKTALLLRSSLEGMTFRLGLFFAIHTFLAVWATFYWSTVAWATLKGIGLTVSLILYWVVESLVLRYRVLSNP